MYPYETKITNIKYFSTKDWYILKSVVNREVHKNQNTIVQNLGSIIKYVMNINQNNNSGKLRILKVPVQISFGSSYQT